MSIEIHDDDDDWEKDKKKREKKRLTEEWKRKKNAVKVERWLTNQFKKGKIGLHQSQPGIQLPKAELHSHSLTSFVLIASYKFTKLLTCDLPFVFLVPQVRKATPLSMVVRYWIIFSILVHEVIHPNGKYSDIQTGN